MLSHGGTSLFVSYHIILYPAEKSKREMKKPPSPLREEQRFCQAVSPQHQGHGGYGADEIAKGRGNPLQAFFHKKPHVVVDLVYPKTYVKKRRARQKASAKIRFFLF
jgi:hypothetical protein